MRYPHKKAFNNQPSVYTIYYHFLDITRNSRICISFGVERKPSDSRKTEKLLL